MEWVEEDQQWLDEEGDDAFEMIAEMCLDRPPVCEEPEFKALQNELDFLTQSLDEIKDNMTPYDDNTQLIAELTEIELERNEVAKQMIDKLL